MPVNTAPRFTAPITLNLAEDDPLHASVAGSLFATVIDPDAGDTLSLVGIGGLATGPLRGRFGILTWNAATGDFTYALDNQLGAVQRLGAGALAREFFTIQVADLSGASGTGRLVINVAGANDAPVARAISATLAEDGPTSLAMANLLARSRDADVGDVLSVLAVNGGVATTVAGIYGTLTWDPATGVYGYQLANDSAAVQALGAGESARDVFTFTIGDGEGGTATAALTIRIGGANDVPEAADFGIVLSDGVPTVGGFSLLDGAIDIDGDALSVLAVQGSASGAATGRFGRLTWAQDGGATYTMDAALPGYRALGGGEGADDVFAVAISDGHGGVTTRQVSFGVTGVNDPARIEGTALSTVVEDVLPIASGRLFVFDDDPGQARLAVPGALTRTYGSFTVNAVTGDWTYQLGAGPTVQGLAAGQVVSDTLMVATLDGTATQAITVLIVGTSDRPIATADEYLSDRVAVTEDTPIAFAASEGLLANDTGGDGLLAAVAGSVVTARGGTAVIAADGSFTYTPAPDAFGLDHFAYTLRDADGDLAAGSVTIEVTAVPDPLQTVSLPDLGAGGFRIVGESVGSRVGTSVAGIGDVNGDGRPDMALTGFTSHPDFPATPANGGWVVFGKPDNGDVDLDIVSAEAGLGYRILVPSVGGGLLPSVLSAGGDVNGDGRPDMLFELLYDNVSFIETVGVVAFGKPGPILVDASGFGSGAPASGDEFFAVLRGEFGFTNNVTLSGLGDINGDGIADILVGDPAGRQAMVFYGSGTGDPIDIPTSALAEPAFLITEPGFPGYPSIGADVAGLGDVNGDGFGDLAVVTANSRTIDIVFTQPGMPDVDLGQIALGIGGFRIIGASVPGGDIPVIERAGDVNGDGLADILVGMAGADASGRTDNGAVYVVFGKAVNPLEPTPDVTVDLTALDTGIGGFSIIGEAAGDRIGNAMATVGDVNGDGLDDILLGAPNNDSHGLTDNGAAYIVFGRSTTTTVDLTEVADGRGGVRMIGGGGDLAGTAVAALGDVDGDGLNDVMIGAPGADGDDPGSDTGVAYVVFGRAAWAVDTPLA